MLLESKIAKGFMPSAVSFTPQMCGTFYLFCCMPFTLLHWPRSCGYLQQTPRRSCDVALRISSGSSKAIHVWPAKGMQWMEILLIVVQHFFTLHVLKK